MFYQKEKKASLTVEAALVLPVFLFMILTFLYFIQIFITYERVQSGITEVAKEASKYAYIYENMVEETKQNTESTNNTESTKNRSTNDNKIEDNNTKDKENTENDTKKDNITFIDNIYYKQRLKSYLDKRKCNFSTIENGMNGISFWYSSFLSEEEEVDVVAKYKVKFPVLIFRIKGFQMVQRVRVHAWTGYLREEDLNGSKEDGKEETVFITETGTVYHSSKNCTHLKLSIRRANYVELENLRNRGGGKYKECERCGVKGKESLDTVVYITDTGDRYHLDPVCSGLKRTILEIPLSEVGTRTPCRRCYKK
ncbi:TadE/TadG family type IV pilus assembly protein [Anaeromicropila herbilytica]|uniref:Pilus assembly protein n=1 Tax=Anaeromicropila herbilytica TaxID=2785025 RepID=A0A7R7IES5_9FIRM|nr:TadE family protein [Anaeromicropila herbilytica]BCN32932.1 hypothetical protein bsdtb5_42270 [Anaeromicropila herbilytica]